MIDTEDWPIVKARWYTDVPKDALRKVRLIVIHDMEYPETNTAAADVAKYFADPKDDQGNPVKASAHICVDEAHIIQCVMDSDVAYAAPGCNSDGIQVELAGYGKQSRGDWLDPYGLELINMAAHAVAQYLVKFDLPLAHLTNDQLKAGRAGIIGHYQASEVYHGSDHTDPGPNFPWDFFLDHVQTQRTDWLRQHT